MPRGKVIDTDYLREHYPTATDVYEFLDDYEKQFGHRPSKAAVYMKAQRLGIKKAPVAGRDKRCERPVKWSREPELLEWMLEHDHGQRVDSLSDEFRERWGFGLTRGQINLFRATYDRQVRQDGTRRGGRKRVPVGTERVGKDGYITIKVRKEADKAMSKDNWMLKHVWVWEQANGEKLPKDHMVMFADRDRRNFDPDNLVAVPRSLMGVINAMRVEWHDRESLMAVIAMAKIRVARNRAEASVERVCACCGKKYTNLHRLESRSGSIKATVCEECVKAGRKPPYEKKNKYDHDEIRRLHAEGYRNEEIADIIGCTRSTVSMAVRRKNKRKKAK